MTNSLWVALHISERQSYLIFSYDKQRVSGIAHFLKGSSLITLYPWSTVCEWHCTFSERQQSHCTFSWLIASEWHGTFFWKIISSHVFLWPTGSKWHCTFCGRASHHMLSYDQQDVSEIAHLVRGRLMTWPTASKWHCTSCERQFHDMFSYDQQSVSDIAHFVPKCILITSFPMTNRRWVALHICERQSHHIYTFCEWQSHHMFSYRKQEVSIVHFVFLTFLPINNSL